MINEKKIDNLLLVLVSLLFVFSDVISVCHEFFLFILNFMFFCCLFGISLDLSSFLTVTWRNATN